MAKELQWDIDITNYLIDDWMLVKDYSHAGDGLLFQKMIDDDNWWELTYNVEDEEQFHIECWKNITGRFHSSGRTVFKGNITSVEDMRTLLIQIGVY